MRARAPCGLLQVVQTFFRVEAAIKQTPGRLQLITNSGAKINVDIASMTASLELDGQTYPASDELYSM